MLYIMLLFFVFVFVFILLLLCRIVRLNGMELMREILEIEERL